MTKLLCPYCQSTVDEHPVANDNIDCGNAWLGYLIGYKWAGVRKSPEYYMKQTMDDCRYSFPLFMTSLDAQAEHVWPRIMKVRSLELFNLWNDDKPSDTWRMILADDSDDEPHTSGTNCDPALASWRACIKYLSTEGNTNEVKRKELNNEN